MFIAIALAVQFGVSYSFGEKAVQRRIDYEMQLAQEDFLFDIYDLKDASDEMKFLAQYRVDPEDLFAAARAVLERFPSVMGCYVGFEPNYYPLKGTLFAPCAYRQGDSIVCVNVAEELNYLQRDWYQQALESDENGYWSSPYVDINSNQLVFTHSSVIRNRKGEVVGVAAADFTLDWTQHLLDKIQPYDNCVCQLFTADSALVVKNGDLQGDLDDMIVSEDQLSPLDLRLLIAVPRTRIWQGVGRITTLTFLFLVLGITLLGSLVKRLFREQSIRTEAQMRNQIMENELHIAHKIQMEILRYDFPNDDDVALSATLLPMREVGGDLYDYYRRDDYLFFIIGDVSGKGMSAALVMTAAINLFRSAVKRHAAPKEIVEDINATLSENNPSLTFVTAFVGRIHLPSGSLLYCNAAHNPPLLVSDAGVRPLDTIPNLPIGFDAGFAYEEQGIMLAQHELLVLYTDGVTEARNSHGKMLGMERWSEMVRTNAQAADVAQALLNRVQTYIGKADPADDITLFCLRKKSPVAHLTSTFANQLDEWAPRKRMLTRYCVCAGFDRRTIRKIVTAVEEMAVNSIHYAYSEGTYGEIRLALWMEAGMLVAQITDSGQPFDPTKAPKVDTEALTQNRHVGGLGILMATNLMDRITYERIDNQNCVTLYKSLKNEDQHS